MNKKFTLIKIWYLLRINFFVLIVLLIILELSLRLFGYKPELIAPQFFQITDSLEVYNSFYADSSGIFKANPNWEWEKSIFINKQGFRGRSLYDTLNTTPNKRVLLLGDSFTWGLSAKPLTQSFANLLDANTDYTVYNTGIPGTAPNQYAKLAETYIPIIKPKIVIVSFYMGNDIMPTVMPLLPYENRYHITNAGWIKAHVKGEYISNPHKAYQANLEHHFQKIGKIKFSECKNIKCKIRSLLFKTVIGSWSYAIYYKNKKKYKAPLNNEISNQYLRKIKNICKQNNAAFYLFIIPFKANSVDSNLFNNLSPHIISNLSKKDYAPFPDDHFNNIGHRKYFEFILKTINQ